MMSDDVLSQEELDALLNGMNESGENDEKSAEFDLSESDKDLLGEVGNIAMGSASTALSTIIHKAVNITTPKVTVTTLNEMKNNFEVPLVSLEIEYIKGLKGINLLLMKVSDAAIISDLMMGGNGSAESKSTLTEMELSAVGEAMNQMIGSAATSLAKMMNVVNNIAPPISSIWDDKTKVFSKKIDEDERIVRIAFKLTIENLIDSEIMLLLLSDTAKMIIDKMMGGAGQEPSEVSDEPDSELQAIEPEAEPENEEVNNYVEPQPRVKNNAVNVKKAKFAPLSSMNSQEKQNIDLIMDVPLEVSAVLGRAKKTIKEILDLGVGSLVELDRLTEEPVEILVNGKKVALGEVVVIDENFGIRITNILNNDERVKSLQGK